MERNSEANEPPNSTVCMPASSADKPEVCQEEKHSVSPPLSTLSPSLQCHPMDDTVLSKFDKIHTRKCTKSALSCWNFWRLEKYKETLSSNAPSSSASQEHSLPFFYEVCGYPIKKMDEVLAQFVEGCKNKEGGLYPPQTLRAIMFGLQRFLKGYCTQTEQSHINFAKNEFQFPKYSSALKKKLQEFRTLGIQPKSNPAVGITLDEENLLWEEGVLGCTSAEVISNTVFMYIVKIFGIVSSDALRSLTTETFVFGENKAGKYVELDKDFSNYLEDCGASNCCHNLSLCDSSGQKLRHYCDPHNPRTFYNLLKFYVAIIKKINSTDDSLFLQPAKGGEFSRHAIGRNQLQKKFGKMMKSGSLSGYFTTQAFVQSVLDSLQIKGYMVRRKRPIFSIERRIQICKILDPPSGSLIYKDFKIQTVTGVDYIRAHEVLGLPSQSSTSRHSNSQVQCVLQVGAQHQPSTSIPITFIQNQAQSKISMNQPRSLLLQPILSGKIIPAMANSTFLAGHGTLAVASATPVNPSVRYSQTPQLSDQSACKEVKVELDTTSDGDSISEIKENNVNKPEDTSEHEHEEYVIKQEPVQSNEDYQSKTSSKSTFDNQESITTNRVEHYGDSNTCINSKKRKPPDCALAENVYQRNSSNSDCESNCSKKKYFPHHDSTSNIDNERNSATFNGEKEVHDAEIEYLCSHDLDKKVTKQKVCLKEDNQTLFIFSGTSKLGRSMSDLDINLGDYLPENCTIKPSDIDLRRVITADGGKFVVKLKYSVNK